MLCVNSVCRTGFGTSVRRGDHFFDFILIFCHYLQGTIDAFILCINTFGKLVIGINLQQQSQTVAQSRVIRSISCIVFKGTPAFFYNSAVIITPVSIRNRYLFFGFKVRAVSQSAGAENVPVVFQQLCVSACIQTPIISYRMAHVRAVRCVGVNKQNRIPVIHQLNDGTRAGSFQFCHVTVNVEAVSFGSCSYKFWGKLGFNPIFIQVVVAVRVAVGNNDYHQIFEQIVMFSLGNFPGEDQHSFLSFYFAGMDIAININDALAFVNLIRAGRSLIADDHIGDRRPGFCFKRGIVKYNTAVAVFGNSLAEFEDFFRRSCFLPAACFCFCLEFIKIYFFTGIFPIFHIFRLLIW